jgi:LPXTG-motif cell wall-anchored protein
MTSKSGTSMEEDVEVSFTTAGGAPAAETTDEPANTGSNMAPVWIGVIGATVIASVLYGRRKKS